jgi:hypothetical protein
VPPKPVPERRTVTPELTSDAIHATEILCFEQFVVSNIWIPFRQRSNFHSKRHACGMSVECIRLCRAPLQGDNPLYTRQSTRWWELRKAQWLYRRASGEEGFPEYLEASEEVDRHIGGSRFVRDEHYEISVHNMWEGLASGSLRRPSDIDFDAYRVIAQRAIARSLAEFTCPLELRKDPSTQTQWTNWLEYLHFEMVSCLPSYRLRLSNTY